MRFSLRDVVWLRCSRYTDRITLLFSAAPKRRNIWCRLLRTVPAAIWYPAQDGWIYLRR